MKQVLLVSTLLLAVSIAWSQDKKEKKSAFSIGGEVIYPFKGNKYRKGADLGGSLQQEFSVGKAGITLNLGLASANHVDVYMKQQAWLMAGVRYYFSKNIFAGGQLGPGIINGDDFTGVMFVYSPGIGVKFKPIDVSLHYRGMIVSGEPFSAISMRVAVVL